MRLVDALRLDQEARIALVGAGGKTAVLFQLGREFLQASPTSGKRFDRPEKSFAESVVLTTTTHVGVDQVSLADQHWIYTEGSLPRAFLEDGGRGLTLITAAQTDSERFAGIPSQEVDLLARTIGHQTPLIIEADGSRRRPLKAPAPHEPAIPDWVDVVVVVAGLSGLGQLLSDEWVHRPQLFGRLAQIELNCHILPEHLARVLSHPEGGLKNIPSVARRILILNQARSDEAKSVAKRISGRLLGHYEMVVVSDLPSALDGAVFPVRDAVVASHQRIAGVVLAAGASSRFGRPKQLLDWKGKSFVRHAVETAAAGGLDPVVVVVGSAAEEVQGALSGLPVEIVVNSEWESGQASSIAAGLQALPRAIGGAIFLPVDLPRLPASLLRSLVDLHALELPQIVAPLVDGQRANPVLFDRRMFDSLASLSGDTGGRALFSRTSPTWLTWHDPAVLKDIDTPEDYSSLLMDADLEEDG